MPNRPTHRRLPVFDVFSRPRPDRRGGKTSDRPPRRIELLEPRLAMDGAGFVNTDPPEDPDSIVGAAGVEAINDYLSVRTGARSMRISPLVNDPLPTDAERLTIKSVSDTRVGAQVTISEDGRHLLYTAPPGGLTTWDSFYYIVQAEDGRLGKADVRVDVNRDHAPKTLRFRVIEDSGETVLPAVNEYLRQLRYGWWNRTVVDWEIVAVTAPSRGGEVRIAEGGDGLVYHPPAGVAGGERFTITLSDGDGEQRNVDVQVAIDKPWRIVHDAGEKVIGGGSVVLDPLANDMAIAPTPLSPRIESVSAPDHAGQAALLEDGRVRFDSAGGYSGWVRINYTVRYGPADHQTVNGTVQVNVTIGVQAIENWFQVAPDEPTPLLVLANDLLDGELIGGPLKRPGVRVVAVSGGSAGGQIAIDPRGGTQVFYTPAPGFRGEETFTYTAEATGGNRHTATVTVHVADPEAEPAAPGAFASEGELRQYLVDRAVARHARAFGQQQLRHANWPGIRLGFDTDSIVLNSVTAGDSHSDTNTQVDGVDEADIVETDGRYVYTLSGGQLAIVDLTDLEDPRLVSVTSPGNGYDQMYLQGDRVTLLRWNRSWPGGGEVVVVDVSDRANPVIVERTEFDGSIADSGAIGDRVYLVVRNSIELPAISGEWVVEPPTSDYRIDDGTAALQGAGVWRNETVNEYLDRVRDQLLEAALPSYHAVSEASGLGVSRRLTPATKLYKPIAGDDQLISLVTIDVGDAAVGPAAEATSFLADWGVEAYVSDESVYLFSYDSRADSTTIHKLSLEDDGSAPLEASTQVRGRLLNQFSADEHDGRLRIAVTQRDWPGFTVWRRDRVFNNVLVLEQQGAELVTVGQVTNLAPTETIHAVRYQGDRAFVVTFRRVDPLFALDLSDPTNPTVEGELKIAGFSNYLHPVGEDFLIGIGRDADEITGRVGAFQIALFNVSDLSNPVVADQVTFEAARWARSEAQFNHLAVSFFANETGGKLAMPVTWSEAAHVRDFWASGGVRRSAVFTFDVSSEGAGAIVSAGEVLHAEAPETYNTSSPRLPDRVVGGVVTAERSGFFEPFARARRALRIGDSLVTVSDRLIKVHELHDPTVMRGEVYIGPPALGDSFTVQEDSGANTLSVLDNDPAALSGETLAIRSLTQPEQGGSVAVSADGTAVVLTPEEDFAGRVTFTYTIDDATHGAVESQVAVYVAGAPDAPIAADDEFTAAVDSGAVVLDVLANDENPDRPEPYVWLSRRPFTASNGLRTVSVELEPGLLFTDAIHIGCWSPWRAHGNGLTVTAIGPADRGGTVEFDQLGRVTYQPRPGFEGVETFTYTVTGSDGLTDTGAVTVVVGAPRHSAARLTPLLPPPPNRGPLILPPRPGSPPSPIPPSKADNLLLLSLPGTQAVDRAMQAGPMPQTVAEEEDALPPETARPELPAEIDHAFAGL